MLFNLQTAFYTRSLLSKPHTYEGKLNHSFYCPPSVQAARIGTAVHILLHRNVEDISCNFILRTSFEKPACLNSYFFPLNRKIRTSWCNNRICKSAKSPLVKYIYIYIYILLQKDKLLQACCVLAVLRISLPFLASFCNHMIFTFILNFGYGEAN